MSEEVIESAPEQQIETAPEAPTGGAPEADVSGNEDGGEEGEAAPYQPNYKFKVLDQEHEFDDFVREAIKDPDSEKKLRELYEKAYGLDTVKGRLEKVREEFGGTKQKLTQYESAVSDLRELYQSRDFDTFFQKLNIPQEDILQWVAEKVSYNQLPPDQKAMYDQAVQARREAYEARRESREMGSKVDERSLEAKRVLLTSELARPEVKTFADSYNAKLGKSDAFWNEVCRVGEQAYLTEGVDLPPGEAIKRVMEAYKPFMGDTGSATAIASGNQPKVVQPNKTATLPNVQGAAGRSPVGKKKPTSIEDLKKLANGQSL